MPSGVRTPFPEPRDEALCQAFLGLRANEDACTEAKAPPGFQRSFSACPIALSASRRGGSRHPLDEALSDQNYGPAWPLQGQWVRETELPGACFAPAMSFRLDRSVSVVEGGRQGEARAGSSRYKTELCRTFEESGTCKYGPKCQFAHGSGELRGLSRHPKYKTEPCRTFHTSGICPYGSRCHFIHNADERLPLPGRGRGFSLGSGGLASGGLPSASTPPPAPPSPHLPQTGDVLRPQASSGGSLCPTGSWQAPQAISSPLAFPNLLALQKSRSADSLSDQEDSGSSTGSSSSDSPVGRRLPIFSQISVSDD
ncbi:hypothetical protein JRQ81_011489 [Phrynocephalus forsythii]|uniref:mRNA decay activator protein ZFP36 n=1 Tax=Phrynocephalus forsythii TaxID=171643 RepID=A0A9Q1AQ80_9SAUR|nr:hypothetical protein JRQ81_011489 [Phrynocephalus forsythii]